MSGVTFDIESGIAQITLNRPTFKNAIDQGVIDGLERAIDDIDQRDGLRGVLVTGEGQDAFCSGGDLKWLAELKNPADGARMSTRMQGVLHALSKLPIPVVAVLNGYALGGGAELALACDFRVFEQHSFMSFKQTQAGLTTGWSGGWRLVDLLGYSRALELAMTGEKVSAARAYELGLCNRIADQGEGMRIGLDFLARMNRGALTANVATKRLFQNATRSSLEDNMRLENQLFETLWGAPDHREALEAFKQKRRPAFQS